MHLHHLFNFGTKTAPSDAVTILEINLISAQDLDCSRKSSSKIQTYVVAYIDPDKKLKSRVDRFGHTNPTWNDKVVFAIDSELQLRRPNACLVFEIYKVRRLKKDEKIGVAHVLVENLISEDHGDAKCMAFHIRSESDDVPGPILNIGVVRLHGVFDQSPSFLDSPTDYTKLLGNF
ncbi:BON1-associated protein 2-like [Hevea brasiliensis]|uniref:BON1-associated protein 2-like n=1 Tax=Hevea brasiliensis TaxID=3981 RepID=UPI0025FAFD0D|nr:BON1-associated protein 2-like [Hevea brasiliensis]